MKYLVLKLLTISVVWIGLVACGESTSVSSTGVGAQTGDGGAGSAQFAGTYYGTTRIRYDGDDFDSRDKLSTSVQIKTDGTVVFKLEGKNINGVINGQNVSVSLRIRHKEDGVKCAGDITITATVSKDSLFGPVRGDGECEVLFLDYSADISGTISASKF